MVTDFFEMDGWDTLYLGASTPSEDAIATLLERTPDLFAISVTLRRHMEQVAALIASIRSEGELRKLKIMVGGQPFNAEPTLWRAVGADGDGVRRRRADLAAQLHPARL